MTNSQTFEILFTSEDVKSKLNAYDISLGDLLLACYVAVNAKGEPVCACLSAEVLSNGQCLVEVTQTDCNTFLKFDPDSNLLDDVIPEDIDDATADGLIELVRSGTVVVLTQQS